MKSRLPDVKNSQNSNEFNRRFSGAQISTDRQNPESANSDVDRFGSRQQFTNSQTRNDVSNRDVTNFGQSGSFANTQRNTAPRVDQSQIDVLTALIRGNNSPRVATSRRRPNQFNSPIPRNQYVFVDSPPPLNQFRTESNQPNGFNSNQPQTFNQQRDGTGRGVEPQTFTRTDNTNQGAARTPAFTQDSRPSFLGPSHIPQDRDNTRDFSSSDNSQDFAQPSDTRQPGDRNNNFRRPNRGSNRNSRLQGFVQLLMIALRNPQLFY